MTLKKCPSCGHQHDSADIICPYCKYSYSDKKLQCDNCGAYLQPTDKVCYVCGFVAKIPKIQTPAPDIIEDEPVISAVDEDYSVDINNDDTYDERYDDYHESAEYEPIRNRRPAKKNSTKKVLAVCISIVVIVALIATGICVSYYCGWTGSQTENEEKMILYFDKPSSSQNLLDSQGTVYNWTGDVDVNYTSDGQNLKRPCKMTMEYDNIWYCEIPFDASNVYFSQTEGEAVRTVALAEIIGENIYYVTDIVFNSSMQLPVNNCPMHAFDGYGINYTQNTTAQQNPTEKPTETVTSATEETQETGEQVTAATEAQGATIDYDISVPKQWEENIVVIRNGNCTNYYEKYNYSNYQCGKLISVYVFGPDDNSYSDMNAEKIVTAEDGSKIVVVTPTDIQFDDSDEEAMQKYANLSQYTSQVMDSVKIK